MRPTPDGWPDDLTVTRPRAEVVIGGESYPVESVSVRGEITTDLPESMRGVGGESVPSASLSIWSPGLVAARAVSPWRDAWIDPLWGAECTVRVGFGDALVDVFTGQVAEVDGDIGDDLIALEVDGLGAWSRDPASVLPMSATRHHENEPVFRVGLSPLTILDRLARDGGWHSMPPPGDTTVLYMPMQCSLAPEIGTLGYSVDIGSPERGPVFEAAPWGWGVWQSTPTVDVDCTPEQTMSIIPASASVQMTVWMDPASAADFQFWDMSFSPGDAQINVWPEFGDFEVHGPAGDSLNLSLAGLPAGPYTVRVDPGLLTLTVPDGVQHTIDMPDWGGAFGPVDYFLGTGQMAGVKIDTGVTGPLPDPPTLDTFTPSFVADPSLVEIEVSPHLDEVVRWDAMSEIVAAEGGALLSTGDGGLRFINRVNLTGQTPVADIGIKNLSAMAWRMQASALATSVRVGYSTFDQRIDDQPTLLVASIRPEERIELGRGEEWRGFVDLTADAVFGLDTSWTMHMALSDPRYVGSGGSAFRSDTGIISGTTVGNVATNLMEVSIEFLPPNRALVSVRWAPGGAWTNTEFITFYAGPWLRAYQTVTWGDDEDVSVSTGWPLARGVKEVSVPASPWRQSRDAAMDWANFLAQQVARRAPAVNQVAMATPDPRLEAGDVIRVHDPDVSGIEARALVVGNELSIGGDGLSQSLSLRLLPWTFGDFNAAWAGATFDDFNAVWGPFGTFNDFNDDPLRTE